MPFERKLVEQMLLVDATFSHLDFTPRLNDQSESATANQRNIYFFNGIGQIQPITDAAAAGEVAPQADLSIAVPFDFARIDGFGP